jgi:ABC-type bacteriocin/lantibiotic exporter with double-glycine peptidase domain
MDLHSGDFVTKTNDDSATLTNFVNNTAVTIFMVIANIIATVVLMLMYSRALTTIMVAITVLQIFVSIKFNRIIKESQQQRSENVARHISLLNQVFNGHKHIKAYNNEWANQQKYDLLNDHTIELNFKNFRIFFKYSTAVSTISFLGSLLIYAMGIISIVNGSMTIGSLFVFDIIAERFSSFAVSLVGLNTDLQQATVAMERIESLLRIPKEADSEKDPSDGRIFDLTDIQSVRFEKVSFHYKDRNVLDNISLEALGGKTYAIVGKSGCGKSTLANLLIKLEIPETGRILFNNVNINDYHNSAVRDKIVVAFQDSLLNDSTIADNIRFGCQSITGANIERASRICCIHDFIISLPNGYESTVGDIGDKLSGGQKQRICLARAICRKAGVYVFDEAFSNIDKRLEYQIFTNIKKELSDAIIILISHNIALVSKQENIIVISEGKIEQIGNHEELIYSSNTYNELFRHQLVSTEADGKSDYLFISDKKFRNYIAGQL